MSVKVPLLGIVVHEDDAYPTKMTTSKVILAPSATVPRQYVRQRVAARRCCIVNRWFCLFFFVLISSGIIFRPKSLKPTITSSDIYFTILEQWFLNCDCDDICGWELFGKYEYNGSINIKSRTNKQITTTSIEGPTSEALSYYAKRCLGDNLFIKFTSSWKANGGQKWKWYGPEYRIDCS